MGKGGGTSWPRPAVCLASVPRAQRPRRAAQNPLHEAPIPACAWTGPHPGPRHLWSSSPFPQASDRKARLLHVAWTSAYAPATSRHSVHTERRTRPATHSSVPWKDGPVCPPPATPARGCGAACGHVQRGARTDPVGLQALGVGRGVPSASRWVRGTPSSHRRGLGEGRRAARGGRASGSRAPWSWTGRAPPTATASGWGRLSRFSETQLVMGNPRWTVTWCPMAKQAVLFCQGQLTYQELLLKSRRILFCRRSWPCFGSPWARIAILPTRACRNFHSVSFLSADVTHQPQRTGPITWPKSQGCRRHRGGLQQNPLPPRSRSELQLPAPHATRCGACGLHRPRGLPGAPGPRRVAGGRVAGRLPLTSQSGLWVSVASMSTPQPGRTYSSWRPRAQGGPCP